MTPNTWCAGRAEGTAHPEREFRGRVRGGRCVAAAAAAAAAITTATGPVHRGALSIQKLAFWTQWAKLPPPRHTGEVVAVDDHSLVDAAPKKAPKKTPAPKKTAQASGPIKAEKGAKAAPAKAASAAKAGGSRPRNAQGVR